MPDLMELHHASRTLEDHGGIEQQIRGRLTQVGISVLELVVVLRDEPIAGMRGPGRVAEPSDIGLFGADELRELLRAGIGATP